MTQTVARGKGTSGTSCPCPSAGFSSRVALDTATAQSTEAGARQPAAFPMGHSAPGSFTVAHGDYGVPGPLQAGVQERKNDLRRKRPRGFDGVINPLAAHKPSYNTTRDAGHLTALAKAAKASSDKDIHRLNNGPIGVALGSPGAAPSGASRPRQTVMMQSHSRTSDESIPSVTTHISSSGEQMPKSRRWRALGGLFGKKSTEMTTSVPVDQSRMQTSEIKAASPSRPEEQSPPSGHQRKPSIARSLTKKRLPISRRGSSASRKATRDRSNSDSDQSVDMMAVPPIQRPEMPRPAFKNPHVSKRRDSRIGGRSQLLNVDIPSVQLERYSVMFSSLLTQDYTGTSDSKLNLLQHHQQARKRRTSRSLTSLEILGREVTASRTTTTTATKKASDTRQKATRPTVQTSTSTFTRATATATGAEESKQLYTSFSFPSPEETHCQSNSPIKVLSGDKNSSSSSSSSRSNHKPRQSSQIIFFISSTDENEDTNKATTAVPTATTTTTTTTYHHNPAPLCPPPAAPTSSSSTPNMDNSLQTSASADHDHRHQKGQSTPLLSFCSSGIEFSS
ncbi:MAG: hypothetical protein M1825_002178 [Sarcosagium campestre]|nr:MAG: hypothetical protein M1825_002178 [Sarcosagium campestre]